MRESVVMQIFCYVNFSIVFGPNFPGGGGTASGGAKNQFLELFSAVGFIL